MGSAILINTLKTNGKDSDNYGIIAKLAPKLTKVDSRHDRCDRFQGLSWSLSQIGSPVAKTPDKKRQ